MCKIVHDNLEHRQVLLIVKMGKGFLNMTSKVEAPPQKKKTDRHNYIKSKNLYISNIFISNVKSQMENLEKIRATLNIWQKEFLSSISEGALKSLSKREIH